MYERPTLTKLDAVRRTDRPKGPHRPDGARRGRNKVGVGAGHRLQPPWCKRPRPEGTGASVPLPTATPPQGGSQHREAYIRAQYSRIPRGRKLEIGTTVGPIVGSAQSGRRRGAPFEQIIHGAQDRAPPSSRNGVEPPVDRHIGGAAGGRGGDESVRHGAESQWIVAARPLCHLQYPVAYLSRLQRILPAVRSKLIFKAARRGSSAAGASPTARAHGGQRGPY
ncbi:hypothetical protein AAC387_Pa12g0257 [Persea americana]